MNIIDIAKECGAIDGVTDDDRYVIDFTESALAALESRIRADERERCCAELAQMHLDQLGRATEHNYFAVASQSLRYSDAAPVGKG